MEAWGDEERLEIRKGGRAPRPRSSCPLLLVDAVCYPLTLNWLCSHICIGFRF
ncbi:hypothetical protein BS47DRAFT_1336993, partial [Hydnum rufescens UP504]